MKTRVINKPTTKNLYLDEDLLDYYKRLAAEYGHNSVNAFMVSVLKEVREQGQLDKGFPELLNKELPEPA
jgi:hypothetical protein